MKINIELKDYKTLLISLTKIQKEHKISEEKQTNLYSSLLDVSQMNSFFFSIFLFSEICLFCFFH